MGDSADDLDYMLPANCPSPYFDTWDRHNSIAFSATKGLRNAPGENNCFVNCAVQVFWHLDVFRRSYRRLLGHTCMGNSCIFCALKVIFTQFQYSDKTSLHPDALRKALAETFANQQRFQLGHMDDAAECFENILRRIHFHIACGHNEDACTASHCLPHQKFSMAVYEKVVCPCGASSSPFKFNEMVHYVSASALVSQSRMMQENGDALHPDRFGLLLRKASAMGDVRDCPSSCGKQVQKQRTLLNIPDVVSVGLVWDSDHPSMETTTEVAGALGTAILLQDMYHRVMPDVRKLPRLQLVAVVCYYGKHYSTFVFHSKLKTWIYFDDATVREIGPQWENVVEKCSRGRFQPLLLLYANPSANPVSVETAPRKRVMAPGYAPEDNECGLDRTQESIKSMSSSSKRSTTPNPKVPEHLAHPPVNKGQPQQYQQQQQQQQQLRSPEKDSGRDSPARQSRGEHSRQPSFLFAVSGKTDKNKLGSEGGGEGGNLVGGAVSHQLRRQLMDGGANAGRLETMAEDAGDYADYTLSSGDQYRRPSLNGVDSNNQLPMPPNLARYPDNQRKDSFTRRTPSKEKGVDVVRYQADSNRVASNRTADFSSSPAPYPTEAYSPPRGGEKMGHPMKGPVHHARQRSLSAGLEDENADMSNGSGGSQHVVVKPKPTGHGNYDSVDAAHTPVQSGLATLPRNKAQNLEVAHPRQGTTHQEVAHIIRKGNGPQCRPVAPPLPPGTPPPEYNSVVDPNSHSPHSRQTSTSSQASTLKGSISMGCIVDQTGKKPEAVDKSKKKVKKEKKSEKDPALKKSDKKKSKSDGAVLKKSDSESDLLAASKSNKYIDRRMVESILKHQGVHRQNSSCSNNSVSSAESDSLMGKLLASKASGNLTVDIPYDNMSIGSQKDSGYGGSDRNSSSSTGSGTIDPYTQYFISKSMVVPRSVNTQHLMEQQSQCHQQYQKGITEVYGGQSAPAPAAHGQREDGRKIMHPIKESSQEDFLRMSPNEPIGTQKFIVSNATVPPTDARPPPVPPKNFAQFQIIKSSQTAHERESSLDSLDKDDHINDRFVSLCKKADSLMDNCMLVETQDDMASALRYCNEALGCLKEAMAQKDLNNRALAYVQKKHNSCLLKSRTLQKRVPPSRQDSGIGSEVTSSVGNRSSVTSSDSDMSDQLGKHQSRQDTKPGPGMGPQHRHHPSQDSTTSAHTTPTHHERQSSTTRQPMPDCSNRQADGRSGGYPQSGATGHLHQSHSANFIQGSSSSGGESSAEVYGTLPRNKSRKPSSDAPASAEVYQSFLNKQKCLQAGVTSSQQSLDSLRSDSGSDHSAGSGQPKLSKSEIRQMLQDKFAQRPQQPSSSNTRTGQQQHSQQAADSQHYPQQSGSSTQQYSQQYSQQNSSSSSQQYSQQAGSVQQYSQQHPRQDPRQPVAPPHRPGQNYGQNVPLHSQSGHFPRQQQQQHQHPTHPQQHPSQPPPQQNYHHQQYSQHHQHPQQQRQHSTQAGNQHHPPPPQSSHPSAQPGHTSSYHQPLQQKPSAPNNISNSNGHPPIPSQKPSIPYSSSASKSRGPTAASQGHLPPPPPMASRPDSSEVGRHVAQPNDARVTPHVHTSGAMMPGNGGNYLVMMPPPSSSSSSHHQSFSSASSGPGGQMRPSASAMNLGGSMALTMTPGGRPLERCTSQPDCQKLVDSAYPANLSDLNASSYNGVRSQKGWASVPLAHSSEQGHSPEGSVDSMRLPPPPADLSGSEADSVPVSVRVLASRFEGSDAMTGQAGSSGPTRHCSRHGSLKSNGKDRPQGPATVTRTRSKSESFSRKPKSVLKNKKNKSRPRKSVTFADSLAHYSNCDDANSGYESARELSTPRLSMDDRAYYSDDDERLGSHISYSDNDLDDVEDTGSSNSDESPVAEEEACQLCNKRRVDSGKVFCAKCSFYMSRLKSS